MRRSGVYEARSHAEIAADVALGAEAVSKRFQRAPEKLEETARFLEAGDLDGFLGA